MNLNATRMAALIAILIAAAFLGDGKDSAPAESPGVEKASWNLETPMPVDAPVASVEQHTA